MIKLNFFYPLINVETVIQILALASTVAGSIKILSSENLRNFLAISSIINIGYIILAASCNNEGGSYSALIQLLIHALTKAPLFLLSGIIIFMYQNDEWMTIYQLRHHKYLFSTYLFLLLSLGGVPLFPGFISKISLFQLLIDQHNWLALGITLISSLLVLLKIAHSLEIIYNIKNTAEEIPVEREKPIYLLGVGIGFFVIILLLIDVTPILSDICQQTVQRLLCKG